MPDARLPAQLPGGSGAPSTGVGSAFELTFWQSVAGSEDRAQLQAYLDQYPGGTFSALARAKIATIDRRDALARGSQPAPSAAPSPAPAPAIAVAPPPAAAVAPPAAANVAPPPQASSSPVPTDAAALADQLRLLGQSQGARKAAADPAPPAGDGAVRPVFASVPDVALPGQFCSAVERNAFYDERYTPARDLAEANNRAAIAYLNALQARYDSLAKVDDREAMNVIAAEAKAYEAIARGAYDKSAAYEALFTRLMAVPIRKCG